ncbi:MAG: 30S ribosomal protein S4 [archaeon]
MGDPKKLRKKYTTPNHPWQKVRIEDEAVLMKEYDLKNKKELWKMASILKNFKERVKKLVPKHDDQAGLEKKQLIEKVISLGLVKEGAKLEDILGIPVKDILERRLQTLVFRKGLSSSIKQARQFVTHEHIYVGGRMISAPGYLVTLSQQNLLTRSEKVSVDMSRESEPIKAEAKLEAA